MEFNIKAKNLVDVLKKSLFTSGITTLKVNIEEEKISVNAASISQDRMIQLKKLFEEGEGIVEEGIWNLGDPRTIIGKVEKFGSSDILNIKPINDKVQITRKKPKKGYKVPVGIEDQMSTPPVKIVLTPEHKLEVTILSADKTTSPIDMNVGFSVERSVLKEVSKEAMFGGHIKIHAKSNEVLVTGFEGEYDAEDEIMCDMFVFPGETVESTYDELSGVFKVLSSDTEIKIYFSQDVMMIIEEKNKYLEVLYAVMPIIEEK